MDRPATSHARDEEPDWWWSAGWAIGMPPLTAATDVVLAMLVSGEQRLPRRVDPARDLGGWPMAWIVLAGLAHVHATWRATTLPTLTLDQQARIDDLVNPFVRPRPLQTVESLENDQLAQDIVTLRPPAGAWWDAQRAAVNTRPQAEHGTVPSPIADELDNLASSPAEFGRARLRVNEALRAHYAAHRDAAGAVWTTLRAARIRAGWLDKWPTRSPILAADEPGGW